MQGPVATFTRPIWPPGNLNEAVVEGEVVAQRVLPFLRVLAVVGKLVHDELVDLAQRQHLLTGRLDGHGGQGDVGIGRLLVAIGGLAGSRHFGHSVKSSSKAAENSKTRI